ncbi:glutaredoxin family protein [Paracoccus sp. ME4]|uniref:glutaredoxin family protein n=1 Tax=Paracoccus sp. ME4 TaxID=3138066 RepID=UPI00398BB71A
MSTATPAAGPDTAAVHLVTVYSKPACPQCDATKRSLAAKGVSFRSIDVMEDAEAFKHVTETLGIRQMPVVEAFGQAWCGFLPAKISWLQAELAKRAEPAVEVEETPEPSL